MTGTNSGVTTRLTMKAIRGRVNPIDYVLKKSEAHEPPHALWSGTDKNRDVRPLAHPFACSLVRTVHSFACSALLAKLARSAALIQTVND